MINIIWRPTNIAICEQKTIDELIDRNDRDFWNKAKQMTKSEFENACEERIKSRLNGLAWVDYRPGESFLILYENENKRIFTKKDESDYFVYLDSSGRKYLLFHVNDCQAFPNVTSIGKTMVWTEERIYNEYWNSIAYLFWLKLLVDGRYVAFNRLTRAALFSLLDLMCRKEYEAAFVFAEYACHSTKICSDEQTHKRFLDFKDSISYFIELKQ